jgi:hypothetical protein
MTHRDAVHRHARQIADGELERCHGLRALPAEHTALVAETMQVLAAAIADCLLEQAQDNPGLHAALESIYGAESAALPATTIGVSAAQSAA